MSHEHRADGRLRLAAALLVGIAATAIQSIDTLLVLLLFAFATVLLAIARGLLPPRWLLRRLALINFFVFWVWLSAAIDWRTMNLNHDGLLLAGQITLRVNVIIMTVSLLLSRMSGIELARAVVGLGLPRSLGALIAMTVRAMTILAQTHGRLEQAMRARAYQTKLSWRTIRVTAHMVTWLIVHALVRSQRIELALRARGLSSMNWPMRQHGHWNSLPIAEWALFAGVAAAIGMAVTLTGLPA